MVDVATSTSFISGSPDSGIPSSSPGTPRQMNVFNFPKQGKQSEAANDVIDQVTNVTVRERSLSLPGNGIDEIPVVKVCKNDVAIIISGTTFGLRVFSNFDVF